MPRQLRVAIPILAALAVDAGCHRAPPAPPARIVLLAVGADYACGAEDRGRVRCWGRDSSGNLGVPGVARIDAYGPGRDVDVGGHVKTLVAGLHTCAILDAGTLRCWGSNKLGELGYRHRRNVTSPAAEGDVDVGGRVAEVALGANHTCARLETGDVRCWGAHMPTAFHEGQTPAQLPPIALGEPARAIAADGWEACALLASGRIKCWGESTMAGRPYASKGPFREVDPGEPLERITLGGGGILATTAAGTVARWVVTPAGELEKRPSLSFDAPVRSLVPNGQVTCGLLDGGRVRCWGDADRAGVDLGLLGVPGLRTQSIEAPTGRDVDLGGRAIAVGSGGVSSCALREDGRVLCWGMVDLGEPVGSETRIVGATQTPAAFGPVKVFDADPAP
jgi:hypothetical protein